VLDAQNFGVPQRRRRVFVVAGPRTLARRVVEVLLEPESGDRDSPTRGKSWEDIAASTGQRLGTSSGGGLSEIAQTIQHKYPRNDLETDTFILETAEPLQPVVGTLAPGAHGSGASTVNGQDAYTGQLVPVRVWAGSAQQDDQAAPLLHNDSTSGIEGASWVIEQVGNG